ncbi:MAG: hypothetical protein ACKVTZ_19735 [Bacteroidia bacterium]
MEKIGGGLIFWGICSILLNYIGIDLLMSGYLVEIIMIILGIVLLGISWQKKERNAVLKNNDFQQETCPRCLGKGHVDDLDIKRLKRELEWNSGGCAYCQGLGSVSIEMIRNVAADEEYLVLNLDERSRTRFLNKNPDELRKAAQQKLITEEIINRIVYLSKNQGLSSSEVTNMLIKEYLFEEGNPNELEKWVKKVIALKSN